MLNLIMKREKRSSSLKADDESTWSLILWFCQGRVAGDAYTDMSSQPLSIRTRVQVNKTKLVLLLGEGMSLHKELKARYLHGLDQAANWDKCQNLVLLEGDERESLGTTMFIIHCVSKPLGEIISLL